MNLGTGSLNVDPCQLLVVITTYLNCRAGPQSLLAPCGVLLVVVPGGSSSGRIEHLLNNVDHTLGKTQDLSWAMAVKPFAEYHSHNTAPTSLDTPSLCIFTASEKTGSMQDYVGGHLLRVG